MKRKYPLKIDGLEVRFYSNDHLPPHFHVIKKGDWEIKVNLMFSGTDIIDYEVLWAKKNKRVTGKDMGKVKNYVVAYKRRADPSLEFKA